MPASRLARLGAWCFRRRRRVLATWVAALAVTFAVIAFLRNAMRSHRDGFLLTEGWAANAELYWRTGRYARRVEAVPSVERHDLRQRPSRVRPTEEALNLWRARSRFRASPIAPPPEAVARDTERSAAAVSS